MNAAAGKPTLLLVDDEERILRSLAMLFRLPFRVLATTDPDEALRLVADETVHVVVSDQKMPRMRGAELLREVRQRSPNTMRILLTGYSELDAIVASVNEGEIFRYINKPWDAAELRATVEQAAGIATALFAQAPALPAAGMASVAALPVATAGALSLAAAAPPLATDEAILVIDDDAEVAEIVRELAGPTQAVHWARSLDQAFALLERQPVGVIVSELAVRGENLTAALKLLKAQHPEVVTIVMTPFQDAGVLIGLINQGQIYRLLPKPVRRGPLGMNLSSALRHHRALKLAPRLLGRHAVEALRQPEEVNMAARVRGFLGRLRGRALNA